MNTLAFLDFDGVICDSHAECLVSSCYAYYHLYLEAEPIFIPLSLRSQFLKLRPFVRYGEDFLLIQELIDRQIPVSSQRDFDTYSVKKGAATLKKYRELFYAARSKYFRTDRNYWLSLNRLYPHIKKHLSTWAASPCFYILSTKKSEYIHEILRSKHIDMIPDRVLYSDKTEKSTIIAKVLNRERISKAIFVDDQIDHLLSIKDHRIEPFLASWGYIRNEWLQGNQSVQVLESDDLASRFKFLQHGR